MLKAVEEILKGTEEFIELQDDRILVLPDELPEKSKGGIIIPTEVKENNPPQRGTIVSVGPGDADRPVNYKRGDRVMYGKYAGSEIYHKKVKYLQIRNLDIVGKILIEDPESTI